jgi:hypothetical protein
MKLSFRSAFLLATFFFLGVLFISSCQKENSQNGTADQQEEAASTASGEADAEADIMFNGVYDDAMGVNSDIALGGTGVFGRPNACPTVTITRVNANDPFPVQVVLDFGTGCTASDGHFRKGKVITVYSNRLLLPGSTATTTFDGFFVDSVKVEGTHKISNVSEIVNSILIRRFKAEVMDGKLTKPSGNFIEWNSVKYVTQFEGSGTPTPLDDIFKVEGNSRGRVKRGALLVAWESTIQEPLIKRFICRWINKGKVKTVRITLGTSSPWIAILDFGAGTCDNQATLTINGISHQITLP